MEQRLSIAVAQPRCVGHDVSANAVAHAEAVRAAGAQVVVFPEMSLTGYELDAVPVVPDDERLAPVVAACAEAGTLALVGAPVPGPRIGTLAVDGDGVRVVYGKVYLHSSEAGRFVPGEPAVIDVNGWRLGLAVCRDTGIPEHAARTVALGIDGYVAGVVHADHEAEVHDRVCEVEERVDGGRTASTADPDSRAGDQATQLGLVRQSSNILCAKPIDMMSPSGKHHVQSSGDVIRGRCLRRWFQRKATAPASRSGAARRAG